MKKLIKKDDMIGLSPRFFIATVEDNDDPKMRGRVRVRVFGLHTEVKEESKTEGIETGHLLWAERFGSPYGSSMTGQGWFGAPPLKGSLVYVFFIDGVEFQRPVYMATIAGIPKEKSTGKGFFDPDKLWPREDRLEDGDPPYHLDNSRESLGESYLTVRSKLPTDEYDGTNNSQAISTAFEKADWDESTSSGGEPDHRYNYTYESFPRDYTMEGDSEEALTARNGHVLEIDATPEFERIVLHHRKGSYLEFLSGGGIQQKARAGMDRVVLGDDRQYIRGNSTITIDGEEYFLVQSNGFEQWLKTLTQEIKEDLIQEIGNEIYQKVGTKKTCEVPEEIHDIGTKHNLQSPFDNIKTPDWVIDIYTGLPHARINKKVFIV